MIPESALKKHLAILGMNGSGKTSVAKAEVAEPALEANERVCMIDPTGVWWGLRLNRRRHFTGFKVYIVGGERQDFPLDRRSGETWAEIVGTSSDSFIFDVSMMTVSDRTSWFTDFAQALVRKNKGPLKLIIDEAHLFAPQGGATAGGLAPAMLHATNNLLALGRSKGLRITMISQRPAKLHKDALTQAHTLVAMKVIAPQDRKAISAWVEDQTDVTKGKEIIASLPGLKPGEGWVWAPAESFLELVSFPLPKTYDSSKAPEEGDATVLLNAIDPAMLNEKLAKVKEEAKANDPAALKATIAAQAKQLKSMADHAMDRPALVADPQEIVAAEARGRASAAPSVDEAFTEGVVIGYGIGARETAEHIQREAAAMENAQHGFRDMRLRQADKLRKVRLNPSHDPHYLGNGPGKQARVKPPSKSNGWNETIQKHIAPPAKRPDGPANFTSVHGKVLDAIRWWEVFGKSAPSAAQVAFMAGRKPRGGSWNTAVKDLRDLKLIERAGFVLTEEGRALAAEPETPPSAAELRDSVLARIDASMKAVAEVAIADYPNRVTPATVGEMVGKQPRGGSWNTVIKHLRDLEIIDTQGGIRAQDWLFP